MIRQTIERENREWKWAAGSFHLDPKFSPNAVAWIFTAETERFNF